MFLFFKEKTVSKLWKGKGPNSELKGPPSSVHYEYAVYKDASASLLHLSLCDLRWMPVCKPGQGGALFWKSLTCGQKAKTSVKWNLLQN